MRSGPARKPGMAGRCACRGAVVALVLLAPLATAAEPPLPPPRAAPVSRLTIAPSEFERWVAVTPDNPEVAATPDTPLPRMTASPPPAPSLVMPPPPPPTLTPPPVPKMPAPPTPGASTPPAPPVATPPKPPLIATLPPDSRDNTPVPAAPAMPARPGEIRILYAADATDLPQAARGDLDRMAAWLQANPSVRVRIVGYAGPTGKSGSQARRRSLLRALAVRTYLVANGVLSTRINVKAMGDETDETPKDRVEVELPPS